MCAPLYIHQLVICTSRNLTRAKNYLYQNPVPELLDSTSDRIRYFRYKNTLLQTEVALAIGIAKNTYVKYERGISICPREKLVLLAGLFKIDVEDLLDEYNHFLYIGAGNQMQQLRKRLDLSQKEFGKLLGVHATAVYKWEHEIRTVTPELHLKLQELEAQFDKKGTKREIYKTI